MDRDDRTDRRDSRIVAVGLLTASDLDTLGKGFSRIFPVSDDASFDDLLAHIDRLTGGDGDTSSRR